MSYKSLFGASRPSPAARPICAASPLHASRSLTPLLRLCSPTVLPRLANILSARLRPDYPGSRVERRKSRPPLGGCTTGARQSSKPPLKQLSSAPITRRIIPRTGETGSSSSVPRGVRVSAREHKKGNLFGCPLANLSHLLMGLLMRFEHARNCGQIS